MAKDLKALPTKLYAVTLIRSGIGRPYWEKRTLKALRLTKLNKTIIHKSSPSVNGMLLNVKKLIDVKPIALRTDIQNSPTKGEFLADNGDFFISESQVDRLCRRLENVE